MATLKTAWPTFVETPSFTTMSACVMVRNSSPLKVKRSHPEPLQNENAVATTLLVPGNVPLTSACGSLAMMRCSESIPFLVSAVAVAPRA